MKNRKILYLALLTIVGLTFLAFKMFNPKAEVVASKFQKVLSEKDLNQFPRYIPIAIYDSRFDSSNYKKIAARNSNSSNEHFQIGQKLYTLALSKAYYGHEKIRLLEIAKAHLLLSKEMRGHQ